MQFQNQNKNEVYMGMKLMIQNLYSYRFKLLFYKLNKRKNIA